MTISFSSHLGQIQFQWTSLHGLLKMLARKKCTCYSEATTLKPNTMGSHTHTHGFFSPITPFFKLYSQIGYFQSYIKR
jgi:hypothetical protein